jgi:glutamine amidotransferase
MITIIDYKAGNIKSIQNMLRKAGVESIITDEIEKIKTADKLILPGVGSYDHGVENLQKQGIFDVIIEKANNKTPLLGICLGAQLLGHHSHEGQLKGLGLIDMEVVKFNREKLHNSLKIPHMGWSDIDITQPGSPLFSGFKQTPRFYFVHSYHFETNQPDLVSSSANYGYKFAASVERDNIFGVQFHPEKSHSYGLELLRSFAQI